MKYLLKVVLIMTLFIWVSERMGYTQEPLSDEQVEKLITLALPDKPPAEPKKPRKVLIFTLQYGYYHECTPVGVKALTMLGEKTGAYEAVHSEDIAMFEPDKLKQFDAVIMFQTMGELFTSPTPEKKLAPTDETATGEREKRLKQSFKEFVSSGKGLIGIHAATASFGGWPEFGEMLGAYFSGHPEPQPVWVKNEEPGNPVNEAFGGQNFQIKDEIYRFTDQSSKYCRFSSQPYSREKLRVLLSLDFSKEVPDKSDRKDGDAPISWIKTYGSGHVFYCSLGHFDELYWNPMVLRHYLAGIQFALGDLAVDVTPSGPMQPIAATESNLPAECPQGFVNIFNGQNLSGWDSDQRFWSVKDGIIVGQVDPGVRVEEHSYLIWKGGNVKDFELHAMFRWSSGNSGIDYRAEKILKNKEGRELKWSIEGYQADISETKGWMCSLYNWNKQGVRPGQFVVVDEGQTFAKHIDTVANWEDLREVYKPDQWNEIVIVARGTHVMQRLNGYLTTELIDNGLLSRKQGLLGMQIHYGTGPSKFEFKDICIKQYEVNFGQAKLLFNGNDLSGWNFFNEKAKNGWNVGNGTLLNTGTSGSYIATEGKYTNYVLRFQYRQRSKGQTTVLLHIADLKQPRQLKCIQVYGSDGDLNHIRTFENARSELREQSTDASTFRKLPEKFWNDCEITLNKDQLEVKVNNVLRARATSIEISSGKIGFEPGDSSTEYRNIVLIPILD